MHDAATTKRLNVLELFAGSRSVGKVAEQFGYRVFSVDFRAFDGIDLVKDIEMLERPDIPFVPDVIWASPPCTTFSLAAISYHRHGTLALSDDAYKADRLLAKTIEVCRWFPNAKFFIENPVGMMRKMSILKGIERQTVTYCSYGDKRMKPTDIWTNYKHSFFEPNGWRSKTKCRNGERRCQHEAAPRGAKTGTQGLGNAYERSKVPSALIEEILRSV